MSEIVDIADIIDRDQYEDYLGAVISENLDREYFNGIISIDEDEEAPCGAAVWFLYNVDSSDAVAELCLFKAENVTIAGELIDEFNRRISGEDVSLSVFEFSKLDKKYLKLFEERGYTITKQESVDMTITLGELLESKLMEADVTPVNVLPISEIDLMQFRQGITDSLFSGASGLYDDLIILPKDWYDEDVSCCVMEDNTVTGLLLLHHRADDILLSVMLYASGNDGGMKIFHLLRYALITASEKYSKETKVEYRGQDDKVRALLTYLFPNEKGEMVFHGERAWR